MSFGGFFDDDEGFNRASFGEVRVDNAPNIFHADRETTFYWIDKEEVLSKTIIIPNAPYTKKWLKNGSMEMDFNYMKLLDCFREIVGLDSTIKLYDRKDIANDQLQGDIGWIDSMIENLQPLEVEFYSNPSKKGCSIIRIMGRSVGRDDIQWLPDAPSGFKWVFESLRFDLLILKKRGAL